LAFSHAVFALALMGLAVLIAERSADQQRRSEAVAVAEHNAQVLAAHVARVWSRPGELAAALDVEVRLQRSAAVLDLHGVARARTPIDPSARVGRARWSSAVASAFGGDVGLSVKGDWVVAVAPITIHEDIVGAAAVVERSPALTPWRGPLRLALEFGALFVALAAVGGWLLASRIARPLRELTDAAQGLALGRSDFVPANESSPSEVATLSAAIDRVAQRFGELQRQSSARDDSDRLALRRLAHAIRTPLSVLALRVNELADPLLSIPRRQVLSDVLLRQLDALEEVASNVAQLAHSTPDSDLVPIDVLGIVHLAVARVLALGRWSGIRVVAYLPASSPRALGVEASIRDAVGNLLENALKYTPAGGHVVAAVHVEGDDVVISISDSGPGIPDDELDAVRHPGVRGSTAKGSAGTGFGLALAGAAAAECGGRLELGRSDLGGLAARLVLPAVVPAALADAPV
jgi:signal transduction histidine kinase